MKNIDMKMDDWFIPVDDMITFVESHGGSIVTRTSEKLEYSYNGILSSSYISKDGLVDSFHFNRRVYSNA